jgi:hypothetical protein
METKTAPDRGLVLRQRGLSRRLSTLFADLERDPQLQSLFVESPMALLGTEVFGKELTDQQISAANRFLFSVISNQRLHKWATEYSQIAPSRTPVQQAEDLARAFIEFGDQALMLGLIELASTGTEIPGLLRAALIVKSETYASGCEKHSWFIVKVSGLEMDQSVFVLPASFVRVIAERLVDRAQELSRSKLGSAAPF